MALFTLKQYTQRRNEEEDGLTFDVIETEVDALKAEQSPRELRPGVPQVAQINKHAMNKHMLNSSNACMIHV